MNCFFTFSSLEFFQTTDDKQWGELCSEAFSLSKRSRFALNWLLSKVTSELDEEEENDVLDFFISKCPPLLQSIPHEQRYIMFCLVTHELGK